VYVFWVKLNETKLAKQLN